MSKPRSPKPRLVQWLLRLPRRVVTIVAIVAVLLIAARVALPFVLENLINRRLARVEGYTGRVDDIDVYLIRGAYAINGITIHREKGPVRQPFFTAENIDFSIAWRELWHGEILSEIYVDRARLHLAKQGVDPAPERPGQKEPDATEDLGGQEREEWRKTIEDLFPISITHFVVRDSFIGYKDVTQAPHVDVFVDNLKVLATGFGNRPAKPGDEFPASIHLEGDTIGQGAIRLDVKLAPLATQPYFHATGILEDVHLRALNASLRAIANVDVGGGTLNLTGEMAAKDGAFEGYVKPFFEDLDYSNVEDREKPVLTRIWENIVAGLSWLVKNKASDDVATKIPFQGRFGDRQFGVWETISNLFRHGFVQAFSPTVEGTIDPARVPNNIGDDSPPAPTGREPRPKRR